MAGVRRETCSEQRRRRRGEGGAARAAAMAVARREATYTPQSINQPTNQPTYKLRKRLETSNTYGRFSISGSQIVSSVDGRWRIEL